MSVKRYPIMTSNSGYITRPGWHSRSNLEMFCGICLRAKVGEVEGDRCPACNATVARTFEVIEGGSLDKTFRHLQAQNMLQIAAAE